MALDDMTALKAACIQAAATIYAESTARSGRGSDPDQAVAQTMRLARKLFRIAQESDWSAE